MFDQLALAGISDDIISKDNETCEPLLDRAWYVKTKKNPTDILERMYKTPRDWANKGSVLIIDGGDYDQRDMVFKIYLMRAVFANAKACNGQIAKSVHMSQIMPVFGSYDPQRYAVLASYTAQPVLAIEEIDPACFPSMVADGAFFVDAMLVGRRKNNFPTILTLAVPYTHKDFKSHGSKFGRIFDSMIHSDHNEAKGIWRIRLSGGDNIK
jgi:hypothetical protein